MRVCGKVGQLGNDLARGEKRLADVFSRVRDCIDPHGCEDHKPRDRIAAFVVIVVRGCKNETAYVAVQILVELGVERLVAFIKDTVEVVVFRVTETPMLAGLNPAEDGRELWKLIGS